MNLNDSLFAIFTTDGSGNVALRTSGAGGATGTTDHGALTGLSDDDHTQYLLGDRTTYGLLINGQSNVLHTHPSITPIGADGLLSGGQVAWVGNLDFIVSPATYRINGVDYSSVVTSISLNAADGSNPRIDVIAVNSSGAVVKITGTAAASPAAPAVDQETQIALTFIFVAANATTPTGITNIDIYKENIEWTSSQVGTHFTLASTSNPFAGTKDVEATLAVANDEVKFVKPAAGTTDLSAFNNLILYLRFKAAWPSAKSLSISWLNGATQIGTAVTVKGGTFGLDGSNITAYQQVVIPMQSFSATAVVTSLRIRVIGSGAAIGFYLDNISIQGGVIATAIPNHILINLGTYNAAVSYIEDNVVTLSGAMYVAVAGSVGVTPGTDATKWKLLAITTDASLVTTDVTTNNASTSKHGLLLKLLAPGSGLRNVLAIDNGGTGLTVTALFDNTNPAALGTAGPGTQIIAARRDHIHQSSGGGESYHPFLQIGAT